MMPMSQWMKRIVLLGMASSLTSGCMMYRLAELRSTTPQGSPFQTALSRMYMEFAAREEKDYDWEDSWYFADKGLTLAYGKDVGPEELDGWRLDEASKMELQKARIRVMDALTPALKDGAPTTAASIQYYFDCWVEQQEELWQADDIAFCRDHLMGALGQAGMGGPLDAEVEVVKPVKIRPVAPVNTSGKPFKAAVPPKEGEMAKVSNVMPDEAGAEKPAKESKPAAKKAVAQETASYAVFFEAGKPDISGPGKNVLNEVVASLKGKSDYVVILHVAALSGAAGQEKDLPAKRITVVKKVLTDGGVSESAIVSADGADAAKPVSRRIELFLNE